MKIIQFCGPNCEHNNITLKQAGVFAINVLEGQLMIGSERLELDERCPECGELCILIVRDEIPNQGE